MSRTKNQALIVFLLLLAATGGVGLWVAVGFETERDQEGLQAGGTPQPGVKTDLDPVIEKRDLLVPVPVVDDDFVSTVAYPLEVELKLVFIEDSSRDETVPLLRKLAAERSDKILVLDAAPEIGGTLHLSSGQMSAAGTRLQKEQGIEDSPELHVEDIMRISKNTADRTVAGLAVNNAAETLDWLETIGFQPLPDHPV